MSGQLQIPGLFLGGTSPSPAAPAQRNPIAAVANADNASAFAFNARQSMTGLSQPPSITQNPTDQDSSDASSKESGELTDTSAAFPSRISTPLAGRKRKAESIEAPLKRSRPDSRDGLSSRSEWEAFIRHLPQEQREALQIISILQSNGYPQERLLNDLVNLYSTIRQLASSGLLEASQTSVPQVPPTQLESHQTTLPTPTLQPPTTQQLDMPPMASATFPTTTQEVQARPTILTERPAENKPKTVDKSAYMAKLNALKAAKASSATTSPITPTTAVESKATLPVKIIDKAEMNKRLALKLAEARAQHAKLSSASNTPVIETLPVSALPGIGLFNGATQATPTSGKTRPRASDLIDDYSDASAPALVAGTADQRTNETTYHNNHDDSMIIEVSSSEDDSDDENESEEHPESGGAPANGSHSASMSSSRDMPTPQVPTSVLLQGGLPGIRQNPNVGSLDAKIRALKAQLAAKELARNLSTGAPSGISSVLPSAGDYSPATVSADVAMDIEIARNRVSPHSLESNADIERRLGVQVAASLTSASSPGVQDEPVNDLSISHSAAPDDVSSNEEGPSKQMSGLESGEITTSEQVTTGEEASSSDADGDDSDAMDTSSDGSSDYDPEVVSIPVPPTATLASKSTEVEDSTAQLATTATSSQYSQENAVSEPDEKEVPGSANAVKPNTLFMEDESDMDDADDDEYEPAGPPSLDDEALAREIEAEQRAMAETELDDPHTYSTPTESGVVIRDESGTTVLQPAPIKTPAPLPPQAFVPYQPKRFSSDVFIRSPDPS